MKALLAAAVFLANASLAVSAPWATDTIESDGDIVGETAYQWEDGGGNGLFGYECDAFFGFEAFYVQTEERYEETTSYAPDVPTMFIVDGDAYQVTGIFQNRDGYLFTYYEATEDGFYELFDRLLIAKRNITVSFFDKRFSYSADGAGRALSTASELCY